MAAAGLALLAVPAPAKVGDPAAAFAAGPLVQQLQLTLDGTRALGGRLAGRILHRYVSDDRTVVVDLVVHQGVIEQQAMYLPLDMRRGVQVSFFLQDALGSVVGAQRGLLAFRAAVSHTSATSFRWGAVTVRFVPLDRTRLQVLATR